MKSRLPFTLSFFLMTIAAWFLVWPALPSKAQGARPAARPDPAVERVEKVFEELEARELAGDRSKKTYVLTEPDLNAYLAAKILERERRDVESLTVEMKEGNFITHLRLDLDQVEIQGDSMTKRLFEMLLSGKQTIDVEGRLETKEGRGTYTVERATMNGVPLPASMVNAILSSVGRRQDPPFDPTEPFDLPYNIQVIEVRTGKTTLRT